MTTSTGLVLLPAVDVAAGRAVRLRHAQPGSAVEYGDAVETALRWQRAGAEWVHLVDIDAAFSRGSNAELLAGIVNVLDVPVQLSGGIRDQAGLARALSTGCARVNLSTAALLDRDWVRDAIARHGDTVAVGLDVRGSRLVARGGNEDAGELSEVLATLDEAGCARYVVTDVARDGALSGPNEALLRAVCGRTDRPVVASGGVGSLADLGLLRHLVAQGVEGAIVGQALYTGQFTLERALAVARDGAGVDAQSADDSVRPHVGEPGISTRSPW